MTLTLYDVVDVITSITPGGPSVPVTISTPGQNALVTFSGAVGQKVSLDITGVTIPQAFAWIEKPDGTDLVSEVSFGTSGKFINSVTLPVTGTYTIFINPSVSNIGNATLTLYDTADVTGSITAGGSAVTVTTTVPVYWFSVNWSLEPLAIVQCQ
jgi:hypothetical protein